MNISQPVVNASVVSEHIRGGDGFLILCFLPSLI